MSGSYNFFLHILGFGLASTLLIANTVLERKLRKETDWAKKMYIGGIAKTFGMLSPVAVGVLLLTGIGNIHNYFMGAPEAWYTQGWLVAKIILFAILATNGLLMGPSFGKRRMPLIKALSDGTAAPGTEEKLKAINTQVSLFILVQTMLLLSIVFLSVFGTGKHPGMI